MDPSNKVGWVDLGEAVIKAYATDGDVTTGECEEMGLSESECSAVAEAVDGGMIDKQERKLLSGVGFSKEFIDTISGDDGRRLAKTLSIFKDISYYIKNCPPLFSAADLSLRAYLKHEDPVVREWAAEAITRIAMNIDYELSLWEYSSEDEETRMFINMPPYLVKALKDDDPDVRAAAAVALGTLTVYCSSNSAFGALLEMVKKDPCADARGAALFAIGEITLCSLDEDEEMIESEVVPVLIEAMGDGDAGVRAAAAYALNLTQTESDAAFDVLVAALEDPDDDVRTSAAGALDNFGIKALPALIGALDDEDWAVVTNAICGLIDIGSPKVVPALKPLLKHENELIRNEAAEAIKKLKGKKKKGK